MTSIEQRSVEAGAELRQVAERRARAMGEAGQIVATARRRGRLQAAGAVVGLLVLAFGVGTLLPRSGLVVGPATREVTAWTGSSIEVPDGWHVASETLMPAGPPEQVVASTADLPVGGDQCAQAPEAAMEQLGPADALVMVQRLQPAEPVGPTLGTLEGWPDEARNRTALRECPSNGDELDMYWFRTRLGGNGYWVLGVFGSQASEQRRAEALSVLNSFQPAPAGDAIEADMVVVPDVRGRRLVRARARLQRAGLEPAVAAGREWKDPEGPDAVVVTQEPPAQATVPRGTNVGLRTAEISPALCDVLTQMPARDGDAADLARTDGYRAMLEDAQAHVGTVLGEAIDRLLAHNDRGQPFGQAPGRPLDVVAVHHDACHLLAGTGQDLVWADGWDWSQLPDGPVDGRHGAAVVWADDRLVVWGGEARQDVPAGEGAVYDPAADSWTPTATSPLGPRAGHVAVWTGEQVVMCCGRGAEPDRPRAAAYDPADDTWQALPDPPIDETVRMSVATLVGDRVVVLGEDATDDGNRGVAVAYDLGTGSWQTLAIPIHPVGTYASATTTGDHVYVWTDPAGMMAYDSQTDTWSTLPAPPQYPRRTDTAWTGTEWLVIGFRADQLVAIAFEPATSSWRNVDVPLPRAESFDGNLGSQAAVWTGTRLLVYTGALGSGLIGHDNALMLSYDPATDTWDRLPDAPTNAYDPPLLWTGSEALLYDEPIRALQPQQ